MARARQRVNDARSRVAQLATDKNNKTLEIQEAKVATSHSSNSDAQQQFEEVVFPRFKSQLQLLQKQEQDAQTEESAAEQDLRDEQVKLDGLNDLLDRYNTALDEAGRK